MALCIYSWWKNSYVLNYMYFSVFSTYICKTRTDAKINLRSMHFICGKSTLSSKASGVWVNESPLSFVAQSPHNNNPKRKTKRVSRVSVCLRHTKRILQRDALRCSCFCAFLWNWSHQRILFCGSAKKDKMNVRWCSLSKRLVPLAILHLCSMEKVQPFLDHRHWDIPSNTGGSRLIRTNNTK